MPGVLARLSAVQLDTISVLARSHELVPYARLGPVGRPAIEQAYWGSGRTFEYWAHAACVLPIEAWPWFAARRKTWQSRRGVDETAQAEVLRRLREHGPQTAADLGGARAGGDWWSWSPLKIAVEQLLARGRVVCVERRGWRRVYDLPERVIPADLLAQEPDRDACARELVRRAARAMGVATVADLADYHRQPLKRVSETVAEAGLVPVRVAGWHGPAWADPAALEALGRGLRGRHRTTLISPFDSLVWFGARTKRIFGFARRLEAYVPRAQRVHGYFAMPLLAGGRIVGRVDPAREGRTLVARQVSLTRPAVPAMATALTEAAAWVGCDAVALERVDPAELAAPLAAALRGAGEPPAVRPPASARDGAPGSSRPARARPAPPPPRASRPGS